jgi:hypothetical protein
MQSDPAIPSGDRDEKQSESGPAPGQILTGKQEHCEIRPVQFDPSINLYYFCTMCAVPF